MSVIKSPWTTVFELDFTQLGPQTISSDGAAIINGISWTKYNSANETTHAAITTNTGLTFIPSSGTDYTTSTRTLPNLWLPFSAIFSSFGNFGWNTAVRIYVSFGTDNISATYDNEVVGIDTGTQSLGCIYKRGFGTGPQGAAITAVVNSSLNTSYITDAFTIGTTNRTICWEVQSLTCGYAMTTYRTSALSAGASFPKLSTFLPGSIMFPESSVSASGVTNPLTLGLFIGAQRSGSSTSLSVVFQRIRIDAKFND